MLIKLPPNGAPHKMTDYSCIERKVVKL